ncbi:winged helix-turn-helix transcriptional regulator [bacterium]|nr:winged helix-turn-helix transcriptional regulator [bacterium]
MDETKHVELFKALSVETRIRIIEILKEKGPQGVKELAATLNITPSAVSQHLKVLRYAGLVHCERKGYWLPYEIDEVAMEHCRDALTNVCSCGCKVIEVRCDHESGGEGEEGGEGGGSELEHLKRHAKALRQKIAEVEARIKELEGE